MNKNIIGVFHLKRIELEYSYTYSWAIDLLINK